MAKWEVRGVLECRKAPRRNGRMEYLVDWAPTWIKEEEISSDLISDTRYTIDVLGPKKCQSNDECNGDITKMEILVQKVPRPEYPNLEPVTMLMPYEIVKEKHTAQLFRYYEKITFLIPSDVEG